MPPRGGRVVCARSASARSVWAKRHVRHIHVQSWNVAAVHHLYRSGRATSAHEHTHTHKRTYTPTRAHTTTHALTHAHTDRHTGLSHHVPHGLDVWIRGGTQATRTSHERKLKADRKRQKERHRGIERGTWKIRARQPSSQAHEAMNGPACCPK